MTRPNETRGSGEDSRGDLRRLGSPGLDSSRGRTCPIHWCCLIVLTCILLPVLTGANRLCVEFRIRDRQQSSSLSTKNRTIAAPENQATQCVELAARGTQPGFGSVYAKSAISPSTRALVPLRFIFCSSGRSWRSRSRIALADLTQ